MSNRYFANAVLSNDQLMKAAPSIFAAQPWHAMSEKYFFIPTIDIVNKMRGEGFQPYSAMQSVTRIPGKGNFTKHVIRFRDVRNGEGPAIKSLGQLYPELILTNSHDGASAFSVCAGLFRLICMNGLMVASGTVETLKARHSKGAAGVVDASYEVVAQFPKVLESVEQFSQLRLSAPQQTAFATAALALRYDDENPAPITPAEILRPRRSDDFDPTLWNTFNTVQENMVSGGLRYRSHNEETGRTRRMRTRAVTGIAENAKLNKALWTLAEEMKKLAQ